MRTVAPFTVRWASIWPGPQYIEAYGGRLTTSPFSTTSTSRSRPARVVGVEVGKGARVLARQVAPRGVERCQRGDPVADARGEGLAEEGAERHVLPGLEVARRPVVEPDDAEDVVGQVGAGDGGAEPRRGADHEPELGLDVQTAARRRSRRPRVGPRAGSRACPRARRCRPGRGSRPAGASSSAAAARRRAGRCARRSRRGARRRRSRRSRRRRTAGAARRRPGEPWVRRPRAVRAPPRGSPATPAGRAPSAR